MEDQESSKQGQAHSSNCAPNTATPPEEVASQHTTSEGKQSQQAQIAALEDRIRRGERWMIWLTGAIAFFGLCSVAVAFLQWQAMKGQLREMQSGSVDTHALALAAKKQADAAKAQADKMDASLTKTDQLIREATAQAKASEALAQINRDAFTSVQRAFVTGGTPQVALVGEGQNASYQFLTQWENSGTTPTRKAVSHVNFLYVPFSLPSDFKYPDIGKVENRRFVIGPKATLYSEAMNVPVSTLQQVQQGKMHLYFWGWAAYLDMFQHTKPHLTEFCLELTRINGKLATVPNVQWIYTHCARHDCIDEECLDYPQVIAKLR